MLQDNITIVTSKWMYKDFPYKKELFLYGTCVWTDDFCEDVPDEEVKKEFIKAFENAFEERSTWKISDGNIRDE